MVQWGIIGAGNVAARFAASLEHEPESRLAAIIVILLDSVIQAM